MNEPTATVSPTLSRCPRCSTEFAVVAGTAAQCPRCLLQLALTPPAAGPGAAGGPALPSIAELQPLFPGYELQTLLGRGGMGAVYRARHDKLDRLVAIKILLPDLVQDPAFAERFEREAKALARLAHPGIVGVHDFGRTGAFFFLVMEFVDGANLRELLAQGQLGPRDVLAFVPQLCDALQYAHDHRVVHRDIKPENILIDGDGRVRIADFGLAKLLGQQPSRAGLTQTRQGLGTPHYMAPEQVHAAGQVDHRADLYSLGVVLYEMLTGELPIGRFQPPSSKAPGVRGLDPVVMKSLENDPAQRYQAAVDVKRDVQSVAADPANPPPVPPRTAARPQPSSPADEPPPEPALRRPHQPAPGQTILPWHAWIGAGLVVVANFLPWLHIDLNVHSPLARMLGGNTNFSMGETTGNGWETSVRGIPCWLTVALALLASLLATLRMAGQAIPAGAVLVTTSLGFLSTVFVVMFSLTTDGVSVGIGLIAALLTFLAWNAAELRRHGSATLARSYRFSQRHQPR